MLEEQRIFYYAIAKVNPFKRWDGLKYELCASVVIKFYDIGARYAYQYSYSALNKLFERKCTFITTQTDMDNNTSCESYY